MSDGLSDGDVKAAVQDKDGFIWIATERGLNRYDGYSFRTYYHNEDQPGTIVNHIVQSLHVDPKGRLWVGTGFGVNLYVPETDSFQLFTYDRSDPYSIGEGQVHAIASDEQCIWAASNYSAPFKGDSNLNCLDPETGAVQRFLIDADESSQIVALQPDGTGSVWLGVAQAYQGGSGPANGMFHFDKSTENLVRVEPEGGFGGNGPGPGVLDFTEDADGSLWVSAWGAGLWKFQPSDRSFERVTSLGGQPISPYVIATFIDIHGDLWGIESADRAWVIEGSSTKLFRFDRTANELKRYPDGLDDKCKFSQFFYASGTATADGHLWLGARGGGLCHIDVATRDFLKLNSESGEPLRLRNDVVRAVLVDRNGVFWVANPTGVNRLDQQAAKAQFLPHLPGVLHFLEDRQGRIWAGGHDGLKRIDPQTGVVLAAYGGEEPGPDSVGSHTIYYLYESADGAIWLATRSGVARFVPGRGIFTHHRPPDRPGAFNATVLADGPSGKIWVGSNRGLYELDPLTGIIEKSAFHVPNHTITSMHWDEAAHTLWFGTHHFGLAKLSIDTDELVYFTEKNSNLQHDHVVGILADDDGRLWLSTARGLARFSPDSNAIKIFGASRNLQPLEFHQNAAYRSPDGRMLFGGAGGLNVLDPKRIQDDPTPPRLVIETVKVFDRKSSEEGEMFREVYHHGQGAQEITLSPPFRDVLIEFVGLHFDRPESNAYAYQLEGFDLGWRDAKRGRSASYSNLDPGDYVFRVRAANSDGVWTQEPTEFRFEVLTPWWRSDWLGGTLFLALIAFVAVGRRLQNRKAEQTEKRLRTRVAKRTTELENAMRVVADQAERLQHLDRAKSLFLENITHELRTPLTLAIGPLQDLRRGVHGALPARAKQDVEIAIDNAYRLLGLVEQLLGVAKLDSAEVSLSRVKTDLAGFARDVSQRFAGAAKNRGIDYRVRIPPQPLEAWVDVAHLEQAVTNLLANSFRFVPRGGSVYLTVSPGPAPGQATIRVQDNGPGISREDVPHIFDRFYVGKQRTADGSLGTGIGLAMVKQIVDLHGGEVTHEVPEGGGAAFEIVLEREPQDTVTIEQSHAEPNEESAAVGTAAGLGSTESSDDDQAPSVLIVDDNADVRRYVASLLPDGIVAIEVADGGAALNALRAHAPDLIVADIMMPSTNGLDLVASLKNDPEFSAIPIIMLTARATAADRMKGLKAGADAYVTNPFDPEELRLRIKNLLTSHDRPERNGRPSRDNGSKANGASKPKTDPFVSKVRQHVNSRLGDSTLTVEELAKAVAVSRVHLYRRLQEVAHVTPTDLILEMRLERAAEMLGHSDDSVGEVADAVGFKNPSHFSKRFRDKFGVTPRRFKERGKANAADASG